MSEYTGITENDESAWDDSNGDLAVLYTSCQRMIRRKKTQTLSVGELRAVFIRQADRVEG
jgi:predicted HNH restriction endonuclease